MRLVIILTKEVPDEATAQALTNIVKTKLADHPEITITASTNQQIEPPPQ